jgi:hypothetical protein
VTTPEGSFISVQTAVVAPKSVGSLTLASAEGGTFTQPLIDLNLYADPFDIDAMLQAINDTETFLSTTPWTQDNFIISVVGRNSTSIGTTEEKIAFMRNNSLTANHPIGTARMGVKEDSVTDSRLRVRGVKGVRVVDASVFVSGFIFLMSMNKRQTGAMFFSPPYLSVTLTRWCIHWQKGQRTSSKRIMECHCEFEYSLGQSEFCSAQSV